MVDGTIDSIKPASKYGERVDPVRTPAEQKGREAQLRRVDQANGFR
jgi:hypothetical protein